MEHEEFKKQRKQIVQGLIAFLSANELNYGQALIVLKDAQSHLEHASLKHQI